MPPKPCILYSRLPSLTLAPLTHWPALTYKFNHHGIELMSQLKIEPIITLSIQLFVSTDHNPMIYYVGTFCFKP